MEVAEKEMGGRKIIGMWLWPLLPMIPVLFAGTAISAITFIYMLVTFPGYAIWCAIGLYLSLLKYFDKKIKKDVASIVVNIVGVGIGLYFYIGFQSGHIRFHM